MSEMNQNNNGPVKGAIHSIESFRIPSTDLAYAT